MERPRLISVWRAKKTKGAYVGFHSHNYYELVYYVHGNGVTSIGGREHSFTAHSYCIIPPEVSHDERHGAEGEVICLEFADCPRIACGMHRDGEVVIYQILKALLLEAGSQRYGYKEMIGAKLTELCLQILRGEHTAAGEKNFEYMINFIKENYHERILLSDCAAQLGLGYDHFHHKFKALTGQSPRHFLLTTRLKAAEQMLCEGEKSCTEIAYLCGFAGSAQFSALFRREHGMTPLQYRRNSQKI